MTTPADDPEDALDRGGEPACSAHLPDRRDDAPDPTVLDLGGVVARGNGVVWHLPHEGDLDGNLVSLEPTSGMESHVNAEVDVVLVVVEGSGEVIIDGQRRPIRAGFLVEVTKGAERQITAGPDGMRYLSLHRRRSGLGLGSTRR